MADKVASDESQLTSAGLVAHLRLNTGLDLAVSHQADVYAAAADRIEALERALVTARTALSALEPESLCRWCLQWTRPDQEQQHAPDCKRKQALTDIAGVMDAETCTHERWVTEVEWSDPKYQGDYWKPAKRRTTGSVTKQDVFCARCGITADKVTP